MSTRRPKSVLDHDRYTAELSTGQLVIGVCILLMFGLGCFLLGVLIGKFDPTLKPGVTTASSTGSATTPEVKVTVAPPPQTQPAPQATDPSMPPEMRVPPHILNDSTATSSGNQPQDATDGAKPATPDATQQPTTEPVAAATGESVADSVSAAAEKNKVAPPAAAPQAVETAKAAPPPVEQPKASDASPKTDAAWKGYGVQVIAVAKDRAESARATLESKSSYKARILPHAKNSLYRVVVGPFDSQTAAGRARDELRSRYGYKDAFVLTLQ